MRGGDAGRTETRGRDQQHAWPSTLRGLPTWRMLVEAGSTEQRTAVTCDAAAAVTASRTLRRAPLTRRRRALGKGPPAGALGGAQVSSGRSATIRAPCRMTCGRVCRLVWSGLCRVQLPRRLVADDQLHQANCTQPLQPAPHTPNSLHLETPPPYRTSVAPSLSAGAFASPAEPVIIQVTWWGSPFPATDAQHAATPQAQRDFAAVRRSRPPPSNMQVRGPFRCMRPFGPHRGGTSSPLSTLKAVGVFAQYTRQRVKPPPCLVGGVAPASGPHAERRTVAVAAEASGG